MIWKTLEVQKLRKFRGVKSYVDRPGGDHDTEVIILSVPGGRLFVRGFDTQKHVGIPVTGFSTIETLLGREFLMLLGKPSLRM